MAKMMSRLFGKWYWRFPLLMPQRSAMRLAETAAVPSALKSSRAACRMRSCVTFVAIARFANNWLTPKVNATLARDAPREPEAHGSMKRARAAAAEGKREWRAEERR